MKLHGSAALSRRQRRRLVALVGSGMTIAAAASVVGCSRQTGSKWVNRHRCGEGLEDRSSRPHHSPRQVAEQVEQAVLRARTELAAGPHVIGWATGIAASTVHASLRRNGCSKLKPREPREEIVRYERERSGSCCTSTSKSSAGSSAPVTGSLVTARSERGAAPAGSTSSSRSTMPAGSPSRGSIPTRQPRQRPPSSPPLTTSTASRASASSASSPNNGTCFKRRWHDACTELGISVRKTRPYRPQTNGKAERLIRTLLERWAYAYSYDSEAERAHTLPDALDSYNRYRPHRALGGQTPLQRVKDLSGTNT
jgi:transposase